MQRRSVRALLALAAALWVALGCGVPTLQAKTRAEDAGTAWIGLGVRDLDADELATLGLAPGTHGVVVTRVVDTSPAAAAGVLPGDVITHVESRPVRSADDFVHRVQRHAAGERIEVRLQRDGKEKRLTVKLAAQPEDDVAMQVEPFRLPGRVQRIVGFDGVQMGVHGIDLDDRDLAAYFGVQPGSGVLVTDVVSGSGAAAAGIRGGDVLLAVAGTPVNGMAALRETLRAHTDGDTVEVRLRRAQREQSVRVELQEDSGDLSSLMLRRHSPRGLQLFEDRDDLRHELDALRRDLDALRDEMRQEKR